MKSSAIHIRAISQEMPQPSITKICLKITCLKFHSNFPGVNALTRGLKAYARPPYDNKMELLYNMVQSKVTWWRHQMETFSVLLALCVGNSQVTGKGQWCGALMFSLIHDWINGWVNNREAGDLRCHCAHYDVTVMRSISYFCHCHILCNFML